MMLKYSHWLSAVFAAAAVVVSVVVAVGDFVVAVVCGKSLCRFYRFCPKVIEI